MTSTTPPSSPATPAAAKPAGKARGPRPNPLLSYFAPCPRGLEPVLATELKFLGASNIVVTEGGVEFQGDLGVGYAVNLRSRIASRVLRAVDACDYRDEQDLYELALQQPWESWNSPDATLRVDLVGKHAQLESLAFATLKVKDAICDRYREHCGVRPDIDTRHPLQRAFVFVDEWRAVLYRDMSGEPLFKRGWRLEKGDAPLRENLAAGLLGLAGWTRDQPLVDPMCGSGTFIVEAALIAAGVAAGARRYFAFQNALDFDERLWQRLLDAVPEPALKRVPPMVANDLDADMLEVLKRNLERAGLDSLIGQKIQLRQGDATEVKAPAPRGILVANPPYGERIKVQQAPRKLSGPAGRAPRKPQQALEAEDPVMLQFYADLGTTLKHQFAGWHAWILTNDMHLPGKLQLKASRRTPVFNGAIECRWFGFDLIEGSMRRKPTTGTPA